jgi:osmotically-inducible protein OsmY
MNIHKSISALFLSGAIGGAALVSAQTGTFEQQRETTTTQQRTTQQQTGQQMGQQQQWGAQMSQIRVQRIEREQLDQAVTANEVIGKDVFSQDGERLGTIHDLKLSKFQGHSKAENGAGWGSQRDQRQQQQMQQRQTDGTQGAIRTETHTTDRFEQRNDPEFGTFESRERDPQHRQTGAYRAAQEQEAGIAAERETTTTRQTTGRGMTTEDTRAQTGVDARTTAGATTTPQQATGWERAGGTQRAAGTQRVGDDQDTGLGAQRDRTEAQVRADQVGGAAATTQTGQRPDGASVRLGETEYGVAATRDRQATTGAQQDTAGVRVGDREVGVTATRDRPAGQQTQVNISGQDQRTVTQLRERISQDPQLSNLHGVSINVEQDRVVLSGQVQDQNQKQQLTQLVRREAQGKQVVDQIQVSQTGMAGMQHQTGQQHQMGQQHMQMGQSGLLQPGEDVVAIISVGGFLGIGAEYYSVSFDQLQYNAQEDHYILPMSQQQFAQIREQGDQQFAAQRDQQQTGVAAQRQPGQQTQQTQMNITGQDQRTVTQLRERISQDRQLSQLQGVTINVEQDRVVLSGRVQEQSQKQQLTELVRREAQGKQVVDQIQVGQQQSGMQQQTQQPGQRVGQQQQQPGQRVGQQQQPGQQTEVTVTGQDQQTISQLRERIREDRQLSQQLQGVTINVEEERVVLTGRVQNQNQKQRLTDLVRREAEGKQVVDQIEVGQPGQQQPPAGRM